MKFTPDLTIDFSKYQTNSEGITFKYEDTLLAGYNRFGDRILEIDLKHAEHGIFSDAWYGFVESSEFITIMDGIMFDLFTATKSIKKICNTQQLIVGMDTLTSEWFKNYYMPKLVDHGLRYNAIIIPDDRYARASMEFFEKNLSNNYAAVFSSVDIALLWLRAIG